MRRELCENSCLFFTEASTKKKFPNVLYIYVCMFEKHTQADGPHFHESLRVFPTIYTGCSNATNKIKIVYRILRFCFPNNVNQQNKVCFDYCIKIN